MTTEETIRDLTTSPTLRAESVVTQLEGTLGELNTIELYRDEAVAAKTSPLRKEAQRYTELGELGRGGLGVVVEAFDEDLGRPVAIKRPHGEYGHPDLQKTLVQEARLTAQLEHPNVPAVHDLGVDERGRPFFSMTRLQGATLDELNSSGELSLGRKLRIFLQVGFAVAYAHDRGVLHRDLKPENVIVGEFGEVRLMDWGIAHVLNPPEEDSGDSSRAGSSGGFVGTPGYAAPEQVEGAGDVDERADIYALGGVLYELVAGRAPVRGSTTIEVLFKTSEGDIAPVNSLAPVSERLAAVIHKALALRREDRYQTVLELLEDVEAYIEGRPVSAHEEGVLERFGSWYVGRPPELGRIRTWQIDLVGFGCTLIGFALALLGVMWFGVGDWMAIVATALFVVGIVANIPIFYTYFRAERAEDPGVVIPLREKIGSSRTRDGV